MATTSPWPCDIKPRRNGLDYQGRYEPWADTYHTEPGALEQRPGLHLVATGDHGAAHTHSGITSDSDRDKPAPTLWQRIVRLFIADYPGRNLL